MLERILCKKTFLAAEDNKDADILIEALKKIVDVKSTTICEFRKG